jgi:ketosteroid isomerase-like protein
MKRYFAICPAARIFQTAIPFFLAAVLFLTCGSPAAAQKEKKKKKDTSPPTDTSNMMIPLADEQQIDYLLSDMLGAWQVGDIEKLHKDYADDVSIVNGSWAPPILGWTNYLAVYQGQRARMKQVRMDRSNTYIKVSGTVGWACYQWDFAAVVDGQPSASQGHTTVVVEKRSNRWVIVHNHTSLAAAPPPEAPPAKPADTPAKPAAP